MSIVLQITFAGRASPRLVRLPEADGYMVDLDLCVAMSHDRSRGGLGLLSEVRLVDCDVVAQNQTLKWGQWSIVKDGQVVAAHLTMREMCEKLMEMKHG